MSIFGQSLNLSLDTTSSDGAHAALNDEVVNAGALTGQLRISEAGELTLPVAAQAGSFDVVVSVTDSAGATAEQTFAIDVGGFE